MGERNQGPTDRMRIVDLHEAGNRGPEHRVYIINPEDFDRFRGAAVTRSIQTITDDTSSDVSFDTEEYDSGDFFNIALPTRLTAPFTGIYSVKASCQYAVDADGRRSLGIWSSRSPFFAIARTQLSASSSSNTEIAVSCDLRLLAGDYVRLVAGVALAGQNISGNFRMSIQFLGRD